MSDPTIPPTPVDYATPFLPVSDPNARTWGTIAHASALVGIVVPFGNLIGPLVVWLMKKDELPFAADQAKEALNFNITWTIALGLAAATFCIGIGFIIVPLVGLFMLVMTIIAITKANAGVWYRYPATIRLVT